MANSKKSKPKSETSSTREPTATGLAKPFPSAPKTPAKHELRITYGPDGKQYILLFAATYAAKKFLDAVVGDDTIRWIGDDRFTNNDNTSDKFAPSEWVITEAGDGSLRKTYDYKYTAKEKDWELPAPFTHYVEAIHGQTVRIIERPPEEKTRAKQSPIGKKREVSKDEITIGDIAQELKMPASKARQALRASKLKKPEGGWVAKKGSKEEIAWREAIKSAAK